MGDHGYAYHNMRMDVEEHSKKNSKYPMNFKFGARYYNINNENLRAFKDICERYGKELGLNEERNEKHVNKEINCFN